MFWLLTGKREVEKIKDDTKKSFDSVKKDISSVSEWIKHLDSEKNLHKKDIEEIKGVLTSIKEDITELKNVVSVMNELKTNRVFKTARSV